MASDVTTPSTPWLANVQLRENPSLRLICFPYAGGSSIVFHNWKLALSPAVEIFPVQLPGRGMRIQQAPFKRIGPLIEAMIEGLSPFLRGRFAFLGHSMGALIAYELANALMSRGQRGPEKLYVSGRQAPHLAQSDPGFDSLSQDQFVERLRNLNGTPRTLLENPELLELVLPILRADFELVHTYAYRKCPRLACPIKAYGGQLDNDVTPDKLAAWADHTSSDFSMEILPGDHFFIHQQKHDFLRSLSSDLDKLLTRTDDHAALTAPARASASSYRQANLKQVIEEKNS